MGVHVVDMKLSLPVSKPFSLHQSIEFIRRFPPCRADYAMTDDSITAAVSIDGAAHCFTLRGDSEVTVEVPDGSSAAVRAALVARAAHLVGANDDVGELYRRAKGDAPFETVIARLHGLHHVRFLTLAEIAVYAVMMQRTPIALAARLKRRFVERFGQRVDSLYAFPELAELATLTADEIHAAIQHRPKADKIAVVVRGVAAIGERFLATAPYAEARDALLAIPGIGPFSAGAILLRGLGRMDELPAMNWFEDDARQLYGRRFSARAILARYGTMIGYWSFYLKTGVPRLEVTASSARCLSA
jgi:DNA-3-methyladenine glycosylase II